MKNLVFVGLGNPGKQYRGTRHNLGFLVVDELARELGAHFTMQAKFEAEVAEKICGETKVYFLLPQTYMNESGRAISRFLHFYKLSKDDLVIAVDDMDLAFGKMKLKEQGSSAGHNGLKSIQAAVSSTEYVRLKLGIGRSAEMPSHEYVLSRFTAEEQGKLSEFVMQAVGYLKRLLTEDFHKVANDSNRKVESSRGE